jgi:hypothetical protein
MKLLTTGAFQFLNDLVDDNGVTIYDYSAGEVPRTTVGSSLGTNPGTYGPVLDMTVDGNSAAGTAHAYSFSLDGQAFASIKAESDGAGGIQNPEYEFGVPLGLLAQAGAPGATAQGDLYYDSDEETPKYANAGGGYQRPLARVDTEQFDKDESGTVQAGNIGVTWFTHVPDGGTIEIYQAGLLLDSLAAAPTDLDLVIYTGDNAGNATKRTTILAGDGATVYDDETGSPLASWTNSTGAGLTTAIGVDNGNFNAGTGAAQDVVTSYMGQVV